MELIILNGEFTVCKAGSVKDVDFSREFVFLAKTDDELSLVCETSAVPHDCVAAERGFRGLRVAGELDFGLTGVIARISGVLDGGGISLFVVSTYNTDYVFVKKDVFDKAVGLLSESGYAVVEAQSAADGPPNR